MLKMRTILVVLCFFFSVCNLYAQVGIGTAAPNAAAVLDINSQISLMQYGGVKFPTVTLAQRALITLPIPEGLMIFLKDGSQRCLQLFDETTGSWANVYCLNNPPVASSVITTGSYNVENVITGSFIYTDFDLDLQGTSQTQWYRADDALGTNRVLIAGATSATYTLLPVDGGEYITYGVTPVAQTGVLTGTQVLSAYSLIGFKPVVVSFNPLTQIKAENAAVTAIPLRFTLSNTTYAAIDVTITASSNAGGRLTPGTAAQTITIPANTPAGSYTATTPYNLMDNTILDGNTLVTFTITAVVGGSGATSLGTSLTDTISITDNDGVALASDLFISEYVEGSGNNKYIEIANFTGAAVNLSNYTLNLYSNGSAAISSSLTLTGTLANGDVVVYRNGGAAIYAGPSTVAAITNYNGNDAISLVKSGVAIDIFGRIGQDPGAAWTVGVFTTADKTLVRKPGIGPNASNIIGFPSLGTEWNQSIIDTAATLGSHTF
jgi:hypothetical protein